MLKIKNITGIKKVFLNLYIKLYVFFYYLRQVIKKKLSINNFIVLIKRLLLFLSIIKNNKYVKIGRKIKIDLYVPGFPSKAFFTACNKFKIADTKMPCTTVLVSVTSACRFNCPHCYQKNDKGRDVDISILIKTIKKLQHMGIAFYNIEGGDPFLVYNRLKELCLNIDQRSEIWINATGDEITPERLLELKKSNLMAIMFSLHEPDKNSFNEFMRRNNAWDILLDGIEKCHKADLGVAINTCLKKEDFYNGKFEKIMNTAKEFNACLVQIIVPKPSGGWLENGIELYSKSDIDQLKLKVNQYNKDRKYKDYPVISAQAIEEDNEHFGCTAGGTDRFYINAKGDIQPCEFLNISFGNIQNEDFIEIYNRMCKIFNIPCQNLMCEKISKEIYKCFKENNLKSLPLPEELSKKIYEKWDRGSKTGFYSKIEKIN